MKRIRIICLRYLFPLCLSLYPVFLFTLSPPAMDGPVNDYAKLLNSEEKNLLSDYLIRLDNTTGIQIAVLTIPTLDDSDLEDFSIRTVEAWKLGQKGKDNGALLLVAAAEKKVRIEVGYGLEESLTDMLCGSIIRNIIAPHFRNGDFGKGIIGAVQTMAQTASGGTAGTMDKRLVFETSQRESESGTGVSVFVLFLFFSFMMAGINRRRRRFRRSSFAESAAAAAILSSLSRRSFSDFSGRNGSSAKGFGGFSGGGGGFGGGGASGGW